MRFPYEKKRIEEGELVDPRVVLEIKTKIGFLKVKFLVDSGADVSTLPINPYSELFDFKKAFRDKVKIGGVEGNGVAAYPCDLTIGLGEKKFRMRCYLIESKVDPLLGRLDFWNLFSINFDNKVRETIFTEL